MALEKVMGIKEVAAIAGWQRRRMLRHLQHLDTVHGTLLVNVSTKAWPRWTVTLGGLRRVAPQWFVDHESLEARVIELEAKLLHCERIIEMHTARFIELKAERDTAS